MPSNRNQLTILTSGQAAAITAAGRGLAVAEIVKIHWPAPDGIKHYAFWDLLNDTIYSGSNLETWLDGDPLIPAFVAEDEEKNERFHHITRTSAIGDDVVRMKFANNGRAFEELALTHKGGVRVQIFYYFPQISGGLAINWFDGHLRTPDSINKDFVEITVATGLRSADLLVPGSIHSTICRFAARFGGRFDPIIPNNPCDYDFHVSGVRGVGDPDNGDAPYTSCDGTKESCQARLGDLESYGGFDAITDTSTIGNGSRTTVSETQGQTTHLKQPIQVAYGEGTANNLPLLDFAKEYNPSSKHQDKGTIRALFEVSEGPIEAIDEVEMMDRPLPRTTTGHGLFGGQLVGLLGNTDGLGLETRLGEQRQEPTTYSESVLNYNRLAHFRGDVNPINPIGVAPSTIIAKCNYQGRNTVRVYSDSDTYAEEYTTLRAWVLFDLLIDKVYGYKEDPARHSIDDFIYLEGKGSTFNGLVQGKSAHQQFQDLCLAGLQFQPFNHNGTVRWLAIEEYDFEQADIPTFTDTGASRNILVDSRNVSRLTITQKDDDRIPNVITLTYTDAEHKNLERPLLFPDEEQMELAGSVYGDGSLREVPDQETAFGINNIDEARNVGWYVLDMGRFYSGGAQNNCTIEMACPGFFPAVLDIHENKVFKLVSDKLDNFLDRDGDPFEFFICKKIERTPNGEAIITGQAYKNLRVIESDLPETCADHDLPVEPFVGLMPPDLITFLVHFERIANPLTFMCWFKLGEKEETFLGPGTRIVQTIVSNGEASTVYNFPDTGWLLGAEAPAFGGDYRLFLACENNQEFGSELELDRWYHVAVTFAAGSGAARKVYLDGVLDFETTGNESSYALSSVPTFFFTNCHGDFFEFWYGGLVNGGITGAKVWSAVLTADEVLTEYEARSLAPCRVTNIWAWWPMCSDGVDGGNVPEVFFDHSPNCRDLVAPWTDPVFEEASDSPELSLWCNTETHTGGGGEIQTVADSAFVLIDRIWRDQELAAGVPGIYVAAAPTARTYTWPAFELWREVGSYSLLHETEEEAIIGEAISVLAATTTGSETVDVQLQPGQELPATGYVWLGGELFNYGAVVQLDTDPNQWRLSTLTNRGTRCTTAAMATHATGEDFALLDAANVFFVPLDTSEIGETRDYKGFTAGQDIDDIDAVVFEFAAPNWVIETPADYTLILDQARREVWHIWTPITDACLVLTDLIYEIFADEAGTPGALLWSGTPNQWREGVNLEGTYTYHLRARTRFYTGDYVTATITVDYTNDLNAPWILPTQIFDDENVTRAVPGYDRLGVEIWH